MKPMRFALIVLATALTMVGCTQPNPLGSVAGVAPPPLNYNGVAEIDDGELLFRPTNAGVPAPQVPKYSTGAPAQIGNITWSSGLPNSTINTPVFFGSANCGGNCLGNAVFRGVGGPLGNFNNDYFLRYAGIKGSNPSTDYSSIKINFSQGGTLERDLSDYLGIVFWARGTGNFAVNLVGRKPGDGAGPMPPDPAYSDWNFYLRRFGNELNGNEQWKEIVVYFSDMVQEYGLAVDIEKVKRKATGLQFDQQAPYTRNFQLDIDYVRLFK